MNPGRRAFAYAAALFLSAAAALVVEIVAGRLLAPYVGMSLYTWTAIIAVVLAGLSAGHWIGGWLDPGEAARSHRLLAGVFALAAASTAGVPVLLRLLAGPLLGAGWSPLLAITALAVGLFALPSLFVGAASPVLTRLALDAEPERPSRVLGRMFAAGALGSIAGTLVAGFVLVAWVGSTGTLLGVAALDAVLAGAFLAASAPDRRSVAIGACLALLAGAGLLGAARATRALESHCTVESAYYCIRVVDYGAQAGRESRLMVLDHMGHGINDRDEPRWLHSSYVALTDRMVRARGISGGAFRAFFIGGGAYTLPRAWLREFPRARLTVAEIDPEVTRAALERMWLAPSPRLRVVHADARVTLAGLDPAERFDVIVGDAFHDISVPAHLVTREFAALVAARLTESGVYLHTVIDSAPAPRFLASAVRTLSEVFPAVEVWVDDRQYAGGARVTFLVLAAASASPGAAIRGLAPDDAAEARHWRRLDGAGLARAVAGAPVLTDDHAPVDRLMLPVMMESG